MMFFCAISYAASIKINDNDQQIPVEKKEPDSKNTLYIELKYGIVVAELFPDVAPMHVQRIRTLVKQGFYDNVKFHRVIKGFIAQTGDPTGTGRGGSKLGKLYAEFNNEHHIRGTLSMARSSDPNSANSQFFIVTGDFFPELDHQYTVFGRVISGMEYIDTIKTGDSSKDGLVDNPDVMIKVVTGDMLGNKSLSEVEDEISIVNDMQDKKLKEDSNYSKKSILGILLETKDININQDDKSNTDNNSEDVNSTTNNTDDYSNVQDATSSTDDSTSSSTDTSSAITNSSSTNSSISSSNIRTGVTKSSKPVVNTSGSSPVNSNSSIKNINVK
jgi:peptidylprolyl isomerase